MIDKIKSLRVRLDGITQLVGEFCPKNGNGSRELSLTYTQLQFSKMWLGKLLKALDVANPYPESKNPNSSIIEPTADRASQIFKDDLDLTDYLGYDHIAKVKYLRVVVEGVELDLKDMRNKLSDDRLYIINSLEGYNESLQYCIEAGMCLGLELGRVREVELKRNEVSKVPEILNTLPFTPDQSFKLE